MTRKDGIEFHPGNRESHLDGPWWEYECTYILPGGAEELHGYVSGDGEIFDADSLTDDGGDKVIIPAPPAPPPAEAPTPGHEQWHALPVTMASRSLSYQGKVLGTFGNETAMRLAATHNDEVAALRRELSAMRQERDEALSKLNALQK